MIASLADPSSNEMIFCMAVRSIARMIASRTKGLCITDDSVLNASRISFRNSRR